MPENDAKLVLRCLQGETNAFGALYDRYAGRIYSLLARLTGNRTQAEDLAQETFIAAYRSLETWRRQGAFSTWLCGIAIRLYHKSYAVSRIQRAVHVDEEWTAEGIGNDPLDCLVRQELEALLELAIGELPALFREVFLLLRVEGLSQRETADLLEIPIGTVQSRLGRAVSLLRKRLREQGVSEEGIVGHEARSPQSEGGAKDAMSNRA